MRRLRVTTTVLLLFTFCTASTASENGHGGIIYGHNHAFMVEAPRGWVLDTQCGVKQGLYAVFYPLGLSWATSNAVMYVNTAPRQEWQTLSSFIENDISRFKQNHPYIEVEIGSPVTTRDGKLAETRYFSNDQWGNSEAVAYVEEDKIFALIVLTACSQKSFNTARHAFNELVKSYSFVTSDVIIEQD